MTTATSSLSLLFTLTLTTGAFAQQDTVPAYLRDRGTGVSTSMFGTYVRRGELLIYPFFEYYRDHNMEYKPAELGYGLDQDFRGKYRASEGLLWIGYGLTDWLAVEVEAAVISATLYTAPSDNSGAPPKIHEAGMGDVEGQLRARWMRETQRRPELFSYFEAVAPVQTKKLLIATPDWEFKVGTGLTRGFSWGTLTLRTEAEYNLEEAKLELGEVAVDYVKRLSPAWRVYLGVEGTQDEFELITEAQWHISRNVFVKLNNAFGITSKATDWAPEVGIMFALRRR
jgi:hypothetical protein